MIDILVIGNPTLDYIDGKFFSPGGPVTYVNNSLFQMNQSSVTTITSFGEDFSAVSYTHLTLPTTPYV